jgi:predicted MFS family arabinose efflux permease
MTKENSERTTTLPADERLITPAFLALAAATLAFFVAGGLVLPIAPQFAKFELRADSAGVGVAIGALSVAALVLRPLVGWSTDRFGRRPLLVGGSMLTVAALALHLVASDLFVFIVARCLFGAGEGFFFVAALAAASDVAPDSRRGEAISFLSLSLYLGIAIGPPVAEVVFDLGSYGAVWLAAAGTAAIAALLAWLVPESAPALTNEADAARPRARLIHPAGVYPGIVILFGLWGMAGFLTFLPLYAPIVGLDGAGLPLAVYAVIVVGLRVVGARWPDRFGAARLSGAALVVSTAGLAILAAAPTPLGLFVGTATFACGVAFTMPALLALAVSRVPPEERGMVVGTTTVFLDLVFGLSPVVLGLIADRAGYGPTFAVSAAFAAVAATLLVARRASLERPALVTSE